MLAAAPALAPAARQRKAAAVPAPASNVPPTKRVHKPSAKARPNEPPRAMLFTKLGAFGIVQLALDKVTWQQVAIKYLERGPAISKYLAAEVTNHSRLAHPRVIKFHEVFLTPAHLCIVLEYASGGNLRDYLNKYGKMPEPVARRVFQQLIEGVDYCHRLGVVNRDLKPENTLLEFTKRSKSILIKICDFGYSKDTTMSAVKTLVGTPGYAAPEVLGYQASYDGKSVDVWSLGVMLYELLFACHPFLDEADFNDAQQLWRGTTRNVLAGKFVFPGDFVSDEAKDLISRLLTVDPKQRLTIMGIVKHPWVQMGEDAGRAELAFKRNSERAQAHSSCRQSKAEIEQILRDAAKLA
ncbi:hypothetical protein WJX72_002433 [[Myrmecia] bisecta]|uniref:Protein kinase domain-containing protein n=1 Tax=[Myrmecia] bisecta TaxID=41462 RepID=A0AAW1PJT5_9CHLO